MKKIILWIILGLVLILLAVFGWRVWHYYRLVKKGGAVEMVTGSAHFTKSKIGGTINPGPVNLLRPGAPELGNSEAEITLVEFIDFTCSYSQQEFFVIRELLAKYPEKVRLIPRFFLINDETHQGGQEAAEAALCAQEQGKFWVYHDKLFQNQKDFTLEDLKQLSRQAGLDETRFAACLESRKYQSAVAIDYRDGLSAGVAGTPTFFVNGQKVEGAVPLEGWERLLKTVQ